MTIDGDKLTTALALLADNNLVWSSDFDAIREPLRQLLFRVIRLGLVTRAEMPELIAIIDKKTENLLDAIIREE